MPLLSDKELSEYVAHRGQRVLVRHGCQESPTGTKESTSAVPGPVSRKESLLAMIKSKMADTRASGSGSGLQAKMAMKKTLKSDRPVEFGWSKFDPDRNCFSTVTKKNAGGTRHLRCAKNTGKMDLIKLAMSIYDVDSNVEKELSYDSSGAKIVPDDVTVESAYEKSKMKAVRFYLLTSSKTLVSYVTCPNIYRIMHEWITISLVTSQCQINRQVTKGIVFHANECIIFISYFYGMGFD